MYLFNTTVFLITCFFGKIYTYKYLIIYMCKNKGGFNDF